MSSRDFRRKLTRRIERIGRSILRILGAPMSGLPSSRLELRQIERRIDLLRAQRCSDPAQWHRWYKANRRRQRQLRAMRHLGRKINPNATGLPRWAVP